MPGQKPKKQFRMGLVVASVFDQPTESGTIFNVSISKLYKNEGDAEWSRSTSFNRDDLPLVAKVADLAWIWIHENQQSERAEERKTRSKP